MRHVYEARLAAIAGTGKAVVYGKGKSFDPEAHKKIINPLIVGINDAVNMLTHADICVMNDLNVIERLTSKAIQATRFFFIPASVPRRDRHNPEIRSFQCSGFWMRNAEKLALMSSKTFYFDANFSEFDFFEGAPIFCAYHSTFETVLHILGSSGIKTIYTSGIDYNDDYHDEFQKENQPDFSAMRPHVEQIKRTHGIEEIRL